MATGETVDRLNAASVNAAPQDFAKPARRAEARTSHARTAERHVKSAGAWRNALAALEKAEQRSHPENFPGQAAGSKPGLPGARTATWVGKFERGVTARGGR
jgi:hypothetical protein